MEFIKKHKTSLIIATVCLFLIVLACFAVYRMFYPSNSKSIYGDRLTNAPVIDNNAIEQIKSSINESGLVTDVKYEKKVATMRFFIYVKSDTDLDDAKELSDIILNFLSQEIIKFYDIEIILTDPEGVNEAYPALGYHSKSADEFSWSSNVVEDGEENEE